jgi:hypothetical protein
MLVDLLRRFASSSSTFLFDTIKESASDTNKLYSNKRKLSFESLESRELLSVSPFSIDETGTFTLRAPQQMQSLVIPFTPTMPMTPMAALTV